MQLTDRVTRCVPAAHLSSCWTQFPGGSEQARCRGRGACGGPLWCTRWSACIKRWSRSYGEEINLRQQAHAPHTPISNTAITVRLSHTAPHQPPIIYCFVAGVCCSHHAASLVGSPASTLTSIYSDASCATRPPRLTL